jgi:hypothetical protein
LFICKYQSKICIRSGDTEQKLNYRVKVTGPRSKVTAPQFDDTIHLCPKYIIPANTNPKSSFVQEIKSGREFQVHGHCAKVKGHNATIPPHNTPLCPNTSANTNPKSAFVKEIQSGRGLQGQRLLGQGQRSQRQDSTI